MKLTKEFLELNNSFMVAAWGISNTSSNQEVILETMKRTMTQALNWIRSRHVFDLLSGLRLVLSQCGGHTGVKDSEVEEVTVGTNHDNIHNIRITQ